MHVLREHREDIMTILEVLVHDPLYNWSMTPEKAFRIQHGREPDEKTKRKWAQQRQVILFSSRNFRMKHLMFCSLFFWFDYQDEGGNVKNNKMAERVLLRVVQKLNGMEGGHHLSIEGQVNTLIQQARDPDRLSRVFPGWQPYI